jgi:hypothetical protein
MPRGKSKPQMVEFETINEAVAVCTTNEANTDTEMRKKALICVLYGAGVPIKAMIQKVCFSKEEIESALATWNIPFEVGEIKPVKISKRQETLIQLNIVFSDLANQCEEIGIDPETVRKDQLIATTSARISSHDGYKPTGLMKKYKAFLLTRAAKGE